MWNSAALWIGITGVGLAAVAAFVVYRWREQERIAQIKTWVKEFLCARYGELPNPLSINCSEDPLWPILVGFDTPRTGMRHRLQFTCERTFSTFALLSDMEEKREMLPRTA
jgi:hypothetical protein